ncbi:ParB/RepB/Spo0J family partition protein [Leptolyngbya ohadii]|uniref:ParB/RepB/Spo0J family partition protein n=1 Tax=Leptolyngbya ohadii TaxID=1962290 RepID=UPI000B5A0BFA|nr:ParB/RepB/Spo0J family partition protein [Leptolyngbya ohadii]
MSEQKHEESQSNAIFSLETKVDDAVEQSLEQASLNQRQLAISKIQVPLFQPRRFFEQQKLEQLIKSVQTHGILENLIVRPLRNGNYELVSGERRLRAAISIGLVKVPVSVRDLTDEQALALALIENLQRADLNPIEETEGVLRLLSLRLNLKTNEVVSLLHRVQNEVRGKLTHNVIGSSQFEQIETVFSEIGRFTWESFIANRLPLLKMPPEILDLVRQGGLAYTKAQVIARVKDETLRQAVLKEAVEYNLSLGEIRRRIQARSKSLTSNSEPPKELFTRVYQKIQASKVWENPEKWKQVSILLDELSSLLNS